MDFVVSRFFFIPAFPASSMAMLKLRIVISGSSCIVPKLLCRAIVNYCLVSGFCSLAVSKRCFFFSPVFAFLSFNANFPIKLWLLPTSASLLVLTFSTPCRCWLSSLSDQSIVSSLASCRFPAPVHLASMIRRRPILYWCISWRTCVCLPV